MEYKNFNIIIQYKFDDENLWNSGQATSWIRAEPTSGGYYHGHPIAGERLRGI